MQKLTAENLTDKEGNPSGGSVKGMGIDIKWQNGPLGRGEDRKAPNGAFVEGVLQSALQRLQFFQASKFRHHRNHNAIVWLERAMEELELRTKERESRDVEGTHAV